MILTGSAIRKRLADGSISLVPFSEDQVNPNSYNYRLGPVLRRWTPTGFTTLDFGPEGVVLQPGNLYLGHTWEIIGSSRYAMSLIGRSSLGRLGLFLQVSANLGHTGSEHRWTLELVASHPIRVYPEMIVGQVSFWSNDGEIVDYGRTYAHFNDPHETVAAAMAVKGEP